MPAEDNALHTALLRLFDGNESMTNRALELMRPHQTQLLVSLIKESKLPAAPLSDTEIRIILGALSLIDSNNSKHFSGVGEREGRVHSRLVKERSFGFAHGIGRSGDLMEIQPKSLGSAILQRLTNRYALQALWACGIHKDAAKRALVLPCATGMAIMLALRALAKQFPGRKKVVWLRCDQKSALKAVGLAGLDLIVVENELSGVAVKTDMSNLRMAVDLHGPDNILCILSTTSCFAPRLPDDIVAIGVLCKSLNMAHLINNAYGLQSSKAVALINETVRVGARLDVFVQSTDKNFMVPVGGAIVAGPDGNLVDRIGMVYPGRASAAPVLDLFITLLGLGRDGLLSMLQQRKDTFKYLKQRLESDLPQGMRLLCTPGNDISMAIELSDHTTMLGSRLFHKCVSGARVVVPGQKVYEGDGVRIGSFGTHTEAYPCAYLNVASAVGQNREEIDRFMTTLVKALT